MSEEMKLSQDEIDALLRGVSTPAEEPQSTIDLLSEADKDALGEIGNISFGSAATSLSMLLQQRVEITTPSVTVHHPENISNDFPRPCVMVSVDYTQGLSGANALAVELDDAKTIADLMLGGDGRNTDMELNDLHLSAVAEAMNQMMGGAATAMSQLFGRPINISPPTVKFVDMSTGEQTDLGFTTPIVNTSFRLKVGDLIDSKLMQLVPVSFSKEVLQLLRGQSEPAASAAAAPSVAPAQPASAPTPEPAQVLPSQGMKVPMASAPSAPMAAQGYGQASTVGYAAAMPAAQMMPPQMGPGSLASMSIQRPEFSEFSASEFQTHTPRNLSLLFDVNLNITVELGRTKKSIREILDLAPGSIIELDKLAGEPVDILVNNKRVAIGEVVVIDENFGVRVTDIISPMDRVKNLQ